MYFLLKELQQLASFFYCPPLETPLQRRMQKCAAKRLTIQYRVSLKIRCHDSPISHTLVRAHTKKSANCFAKTSQKMVESEIYPVIQGWRQQ